MKFCSKCGKELLDEAVICPGCGCATESSAASAPTAEQKSPKFSGMAIAGFVLALVGVLVLALPCGCIGLVLSAIAMAQIQNNGMRGKGLAVAGLVVSIVDVVFGIINIALL